MSQKMTMAKQKKLIFVFNISHEPFSDLNFLKQFSIQIQSIGLEEFDFIFFGGSSNLLELHPELNTTKFKFYIENNLYLVIRPYEPFLKG